MSIIHKLKKLPNAISYDGEISCQVLFKLSDGSYLRIGETEEVEELWCDVGYKGLFGELASSSKES
jgi:hypothetical protein